MTTLIYVGDNNGCIGRCDAKCYEAKEDKCDCVCSGRNHGKGLKKALDNTKEYSGEMIEEYVKSRRLKDYKSLVSTEVFQKKLF
jgi:hypothetical protein